MAAPARRRRRRAGGGLPQHPRRARPAARGHRDDLPPQNRIRDPAKLERLVVDLIDSERWGLAGADVNGDAYEQLLSRGAEDVKSGAGQYFTPRALIAAMVDVLDPGVDDTVTDPAAGTGGFLLGAYAHARRDAASWTPTQRDHMRDRFVHGVELVDGTARLAAMNLILHGIGSPVGKSLVEVRDALTSAPSRRWSVVLSNPPFGRPPPRWSAPTGARLARTGRSSAPTSR